MSKQSTPGTLPGHTVLIAFVLFILAGSGGSVAIRKMYEENFPPFWGATARFALAALGMWVFVFYKRLSIPRGRAFLGAMIFGVLTVGLAFILIGWGLVATPASRYQILMATVPLLTIFLSTAHGVEAITSHGILGSFLAIAGIVVTVGGGSAGELSLPHVIAILGGAVCLAEGGVIVKKFPPNPPYITNAVSMSAGAIILAIASLIASEKWIIPVRITTWAALLYLIIVVTIIGFLLYLFVLSKWSVSGTSYGFVLIPLATMVIASTLAGESITPNFLIGAAMVLAGVLVGALLPSKVKVAAIEETKAHAVTGLPRC